MKISVVITTYNRRRSLVRCLESLANQSFPSEDYEIVVVADGCTDGTGTLLREFCPTCGYKWLEQPNHGQAAAQNVGVREALGEFVIFMDDDCICEPGLVAAHYAAHSGAQQRLVVGAMLVHPDSDKGPVYENARRLAESEYRRLLAGGVGRQDMMLCANSSISREGALRFSFDESYARAHDVEAGIRLWHLGWRPHFAADAIAHELFVKNESGILRDSANLGKYEVLLCRKFPDYKPHSSLARMGNGGLLKRWLREKLVVHSQLSEALLAPIYRVAKILRAFPPALHMAARVLRARAGIAHLASAAREAGSWNALQARFGRRVHVLMYHNVGTPKRGEYPGLTTPTKEFDAQIQYAKKLGYSGIRPAEWLAWRDQGAELPERTVMIVFDDAFREAAVNAFPILERAGFGAACMVVTGHIGSTNQWDEAAGLPSFEMMSHAEILDWAKRGIEFGGHSCTHPDMREVSEERVKQEICGSREGLTQLLGTTPLSFAYPYGGFSNAARAAAKECFAIAFTTDPGTLTLATSPHLVPRVSFLPGETRFGIWCRLRLGFTPYEAIRNRWRALLSKLGA